MTFLILFILAAVWAVYLMSWVRSRTENRRVNTIHSFSKHLSILERATPDDAVAAPVASRTVGLHGGEYFAPHRPTLSPQKKRRRDVLFILGGATAVTFLGAVLAGGSFMIFLFLVSAAGFGGYVYLLVQARKQVEERQVKVRPLNTERSAHDASVAASPAASEANSAESQADFPSTVDAEDIFAAVFGEAVGSN